MYSPSITRLINSLKRLPSVGQHTAERFVFHWLRSGKKEVAEHTLALKELFENTKSCERCWRFDDTSPCAICLDTKRDQQTICVVLDPQDVEVLEHTNEYRGVYHVLRATLDPTEENSLAKTKIKELLERIKTAQSLPVNEVILSLNPDFPGETTMLYLHRELKAATPNLRITRLARGLPMGSDLKYADEITLGNALKGRTEKN